MATGTRAAAMLEVDASPAGGGGGTQTGSCAEEGLPWAEVSPTKSC